MAYWDIQDHPIIRECEAYGYPLSVLNNLVEAEEERPDRGEWGSKFYLDENGYPQKIESMTYEIDGNTEVDLEDDSAKDGIVARLRKRIGDTWRQVEEEVFYDDEEIYEYYGITP